MTRLGCVSARHDRLVAIFGPPTSDCPEWLLRDDVDGAIVRMRPGHTPTTWHVSTVGVGDGNTWERIRTLVAEDDRTIASTTVNDDVTIHVTRYRRVVIDFRCCGTIYTMEFALDSEWPIDRVTEFGVDVARCVRQIFEKYLCRVVDYAIWFRSEHRPMVENRLYHVTLVACDCIVASNLCAPPLRYSSADETQGNVSL